LWPAFQRLVEATSVEEQRSVYDAEIRPRFWSRLLVQTLSQDGVLALSGIPPQQRRQLQRAAPNLLTYMQHRAENLIYNTPLVDNYFWRLYLTGEVTPECCPRYLRREHYPQLRDLLSRLSTHTASVADFLRETREPISRFVLLDHMDWLAEGPRGEEGSALAREWQGIVDRATPGAKVLWRSLGMHTDFVDATRVLVAGRPMLVGELLEYDRDLAEQLWMRERASVYGLLAVATLRIPRSEATA
jgi:S-adenosylmethionine-diacylglycerol 3-amino-3-carboxypropyl transferase